MPCSPGFVRVAQDRVVSTGPPFSTGCRQDGFQKGTLGLAGFLELLLTTALHALCPVCTFTNVLSPKKVYIASKCTSPEIS